jgi:2-polyprenyl-3-methyl-5-hydroxy-6-metoxy-1,4-benzoquinol methylase
MSEVDNIRERYTKRANAPAVNEGNSSFIRCVVEEREARYAKLLGEKFSDLSSLRVMEVGAGQGGNLQFFHRLGIPWENIYANELMEDRGEKLKRDYPSVHAEIGNALELGYKDHFDVVFQSTVFTSILDAGFKQKLAAKMMDMVKPGGIVLWYDFRFDNPRNKDVKGIKKEEIHALFPGRRIETQLVTLAPPIGRRIGSMYKLVNSLFPFLRSHIIAVIHKDK